MSQLSGEYSTRGEYHKNLSGQWPYLPVYQEKMNWVEQFLQSQPSDQKFLDVGCGEGVLVARFAGRGYDIVGLDLNYSSNLVTQADITRGTPFGSGRFDVVLILDVLEHLCFSDQEKAMQELHRLLKPGGLLVASVPNLAHFSSRLTFLLLGRFIRTSQPLRHQGDRPASEYEELLERHGFTVIERRGFFPTFPLPLLYLLTTRYPRRAIPYHRLLNRVFGKIAPSWCFLSALVAKKGLPDVR